MIIPEGSLFLAPMEGVTNDTYRKTVEETFSHWDYYACDFLRISSVGAYKKKHIIKHYGEHTYQNPYLKEKTYYQVLASNNSYIEDTIKEIEQAGFEWLDLNLGCPSKTVCKNKGGSFLLSDLRLLEDIIKRIRSSFSKTFTAKIRVGYEDDRHFSSILSCLEANGVELMTIHGRTKNQLYKGRANWKYIKQAVKQLSIPIVGNGDIWTTNDIHQIFHETQCHGAMIARGALKSPWLAKDYYTKQNSSSLQNISTFLNNYLKNLTQENTSPHYILKIFKGLSRYMYDDLPNGQLIKSSLLRSKNLEQYLSLWEQYSS